MASKCAKFVFRKGALPPFNPHQGPAPGPRRGLDGPWTPTISAEMVLDHSHPCYMPMLANKALCLCQCWQIRSAIIKNGKNTYAHNSLEQAEDCCCCFISFSDHTKVIMQVFKDSVESVGVM